MRTGDDSIRKQGIPDLAARRWELERYAWRDRPRQQVIALIEDHQPPFTEDWALQHPDPSWATPVLPPNTLTAPSPA